MLFISHLPNEKIKLQISNPCPLILVAVEWEFGLILSPMCSTFEAVSECWMDESWTDTAGSRQGTNKNDHKLEPFCSALPWGELRGSITRGHVEWTPWSEKQSCGTVEDTGEGTFSSQVGKSVTAQRERHS